MRKIYFVGAPTKAKGIEDFSFIAEQIIDAEFYWFCFNVNDGIKEKHKRINFIIGLSDEQMKLKIKEEMGAFISCSHYEGFCLPIAEAILLEKPVFSYKLPEIESVYSDNIEYIKCFDLNEYTNKLKEFISKNSYNKDKEKARRYIIDNYSPEVVADRLLNVLLQ